MSEETLMAEVNLDVLLCFMLQKGSQKVKVDKRDLPENNAFHCEVCDRGFKTEEKFQEHVSQHEHVSWWLQFQGSFLPGFLGCLLWSATEVPAGQH